MVNIVEENCFRHQINFYLQGISFIVIYFYIKCIKIIDNPCSLQNKFQLPNIGTYLSKIPYKFRRTLAGRRQ